MSNDSDSGIGIWDNMPTWVQWILYVPVVFAIPMIFVFLLTLLGIFRGDFKGYLAYLQSTFNSGLFAFIFSWLAIHLAPKAKKLSAWLLYSAWSVFVLMAIIRVVYLWFWTNEVTTQQDTLEFLHSLAWFVVGLPTLLHFGKKLNKRQI
jgi:hypothetical protein